MSRLEVELCPDCLTAPDMPHRQGCDVERCRLCGHQALSCGCHDRFSDRDYRREVALAGGRLHWTGEWPGTEECRRLGWMIAPDVPDLNHLMAEGRWDKYRGEWMVEPSFWDARIMDFDPCDCGCGGTRSRTEDIGMAEAGEDERFPQSEEEYLDGTLPE
jgi:hypothetical protein